jgi:hypothetical protein
MSYTALKKMVWNSHWLQIRGLQLSYTDAHRPSLINIPSMGLIKFWFYLELLRFYLPLSGLDIKQAEDHNKEYRSKQ